MIPQALPGRLFIVGVPRSGTTLLQSLLAAHSAVTSFTETHFFARHFTYLPGVPDPILTRDPADRVREFLAENNEVPGNAALWFFTEGRQSMRMRAFLPFRTRRVARQLFGVLDELALGRGIPNWAEKTPRHLRYIPFLERSSEPGPRPHFIHVIREGLAVVASLHEASRDWEKPYALETCVARWNAEVAYSLNRIDSPNDHFVVYEELAARPEPTLKRLLAGLGLPWEPEVLQRYGATAKDLITQEEGWKVGVGRRIRPSQASGETLTAEQREQVETSLRHDLYEKLLEGAVRRSSRAGRSS